MSARRASAALLALALLAPAARANEPDTYGLGSRSAAMGSAVAADVRDFSASYYNPAGLVDAPGPDLSIGYVYASNRLRINGNDNQVDPVHGIVGGVVAPGVAGGLPFAFGLAAHMPDDRLSRVKTLRQEQPRWELYDSRAQLLYLTTNLAVRPVSWLEIGGGVTFLATTRGVLDITGTADIQHVGDSQLRHEVDADLTPIRYPQGGVRLIASDQWAFALVYRGQSKLSLTLDANLHGYVSTLDGAIVVPAAYALESRSLAAFLPQQLVAGTSWHPTPRVALNVDLTWVNWSAYESPTSRSTAHFDITVPAGLPLTIPPDPKATQIVPPDFHDRIVPRLGAEWRVPVSSHLEVPLRAGYSYERSPVPPQTGITNFVDADRHALSAGFGVRLMRPIAELPGDVRLDAHVQWSYLPERTIAKSNPADYVGDYRASGTMLAGGATLSLGFP